ncbi:hypothetical protein [Aeromonas veronii]|uniref:hypothetical protein n=1 Tax=Aeromonas TaxID=642 RepID=UPI003A139014
MALFLLADYWMTLSGYKVDLVMVCDKASEAQHQQKVSRSHRILGNETPAELDLL